MSIFRKIFYPKSDDKLVENGKRLGIENIICPYCGKNLDEIPTRKKKCTNCGNTIIIRRGELLTQEQAIIKDWKTRLEKFGFTENEFSKHREALTQQFGHTPSINDTIWRFLNSQIVKTKDKAIYYEMAHLVSMEGKDPKPYLAEVSKQTLLECKKLRARKVGVRNCTDAYVRPECHKLENQIFTPKEALEKMAIPALCQNKDGCRCWYFQIYDE